jgi:hypothetical protein
MPSGLLPSLRDHPYVCHAINTITVSNDEIIVLITMTIYWTNVSSIIHVFITVPLGVSYIYDRYYYQICIDNQ